MLHEFKIKYRKKYLFLQVSVSVSKNNVCNIHLYGKLGKKFIFFTNSGLYGHTKKDEK